MPKEDIDPDFLQKKEHASGKIITCGYSFTQLNIVSGNGFTQILRDSGAFDAVSRQLAELVANLVEGKMNARFHENLSFLQRAGIFPVSRQRQEENVDPTKILKGTAALLVLLGAHAALYSLDYYSMKRKFEKLAECVASGLAYVMTEYSLPAHNVIRKIYNDNFIEFNSDKAKASFEKFVGLNIGKIPFPPAKENDIHRDIYINIMLAADLEDGAVVRRAQDLGQLYGLGSNEIDNLITACKDGTASESDLSGIVAISLNNVLADIAKSVDYARSCAQYTIENDPYASLREKRRKLFVDLTSTTTGLFTFGPAIAPLLEAPALNILPD